MTGKIGDSRQSHTDHFCSKVVVGLTRGINWCDGAESGSFSDRQDPNLIPLKTGIEIAAGHAGLRTESHGTTADTGCVIGLDVLNTGGNAMLNLFTTVLVASVLLGQNEAQPAEGDQATMTERIRRNAEIAKERLHALTEIEGTWDCEFSAKEDISWAGIKAGDKVRRRDKNEVLWGGTALSTEIGYVNEAGEFVILLRELIGWDAKKKMIVSAGFMGHGAASYGTWTKTDRTWEAARNSVHPSGRESSATHKLTIVDENTYTVEQSEPAKAEVLTFKRVK